MFTGAAKLKVTADEGKLRQTYQLTNLPSRFPVSTLARSRMSILRTIPSLVSVRKCAKQFAKISWDRNSTRRSSSHRYSDLQRHISAQPVEISSHFTSREATAGCSLGRKSQVRRCKRHLSREAAADERHRYPIAPSAAASRLWKLISFDSPGTCVPGYRPTSLCD